MTNFDDTPIVRKLRLLMRNVPKGGRMFISRYDMRRLERAFSCQGFRLFEDGGIHRYEIYHRSIWLERRKK